MPKFKIKLPFGKSSKIVEDARENNQSLSQQDVQALKDFIYTVGTNLAKDSQSTVNQALPLGRSSVSDSANASLSALLSTVTPDVPFQYLKIMEHLSKWDGDFSYAIDNIVQLSNTEFTVAFDDKVPAEQVKEMQAILKRAWKTWYNQSEGINALIGDLLAQTAMTGSLSAEIVPKTDLSGVSKAVLVNPANIRFKYDSETDTNLPYQVVNNMQSGSVEGLKALNVNTYKYFAIRRINDKPYAIPPMLSALESISVEKSMLDSMRTVVDKLGMLGFLQVLVTAPNRLPNETEDMYTKRCSAYINSVIPDVRNGMRDGFVLGFKDTHEFKMEDVTTNVAGAEKLFDMNAQLKMSGLKQDPLMLGRNFSTTETIGRVILAKLTTQIASYQKVVAAFLESMFTLHLQLSGFSFDFLDVAFARPMVGDQLRDEQVYQYKIRNYNDLYNQGIITQQQRAQALGFEEPALEEPRNPYLDEDETNILIDGSEDDTTQGGSSTASNSKRLQSMILSRAVKDLAKNLGAWQEEFPYHSGKCTCGHCEEE